MWLPAPPWCVAPVFPQLLSQIPSQSVFSLWAPCSLCQFVVDSLSGVCLFVFCLMSFCPVCRAAVCWSCLLLKIHFFLEKPNCESRACQRHDSFIPIINTLWCARGERTPSSIHCNPPHVYVNESSSKIWIWIHIVNTELVNQDQLVYWQLRHSCGWNMALNGLVSLLRRCVLGWFLCTLSAPSGGVYTKWARKVLDPALYQRQYWLEAWECLCGQSSLDSRQWASAQGTWLKAIIKHWEWNTSMQKKRVTSTLTADSLPPRPDC